MASLHLNSPFDYPRPQTHQGILSSPVDSPRLHRPISQESLHNPPGGNFSPATSHADTGHPLSAFPPPHPQPYRPYQPGGLSLPSPHQGFMGGFPNNAPPMHMWSSAGPIYDSRGSHPMIRTISHAHPMHSATDHTTSSRYSSSPHSANATGLHDGPPTAGAYQMHGMSFNTHETEGRHINPAIFDNNNSYPMSRSTSGATSDAANDVGHRLLTPHLEYRQDHLNTAEQEIRKVSDSLGRISSSRFYPGISPNYDLHGHSLGLTPHPQPEGLYFGRGYSNEHFALSAERAESKPDIMGLHTDTEYERERVGNIMNNKKLLEDVGLGGAGNSFVRSRNISGISHERSRKASTPQRKRIISEAPVRASPRIASVHRNTSYADLNGQLSEESEGEEEYSSELDYDMEEEDEFRPAKRTKGPKRAYGRKPSYNRTVRKAELSLWGLLEVYPEIPHLFPLFYYTLNNDLTINSDSVPLIGSIPSTCSPNEKAQTLRGYFHRGRRVLAQLDNFTVRCDRKYEGPEDKWSDLDFNTRIAVRDVRRKIVERCENYKYTRRDILDKVAGKNKWPPIEQGMIEWRPGMAQNDPAGDLVNVTLTLPTPPPSVYAQQMQQQQRRQVHSDRLTKHYPGQNRSRIASNVTRTVSVAMASPDQYGHQSTPGYAYPYHEPPPPAMYGEDQVPMTVHMPTVGSSHEAPGSAATLAPAPTGWEGMNSGETRGVKRALSQTSDIEEEDDGNRSGEELGFGQQKGTLWQA